LEGTGIGHNFLLSKNPEIKVPRCSKGHGFLKYIVWEPSLLMEQRKVVRFLTLKKLSARDFTDELKKVYGHEVFSLSAMKKGPERSINGRITRQLSEELLQVGRHAKETDFQHLLTGDEPWFDHEYLHDSAWASSRATLPIRKAQTIQTKK
jgi:hypothetical protein